MSQVDKQFLEQLKNRLWHMKETGDYSDVTFQIGEEQIPCHKNILAAACPYFHSMFTNQVMLQQDNAKVIHIKTMPADTFKGILKYIYTGEIQLTQDNAQNFLEAADLMDFSALLKQCTDFMVEEMEPANCLGMWQAARIVNAKTLEEVALNFALEKFEEVCEEEEFQFLDRDSLRMYLCDISINAPSEDFICAKALKWMDHDPKERLLHFVKIFPCLQLQNLSAHFIQYSLLKHDDLIQHSETLSLLHDLLKHVIFYAPLPHHISSNFPRLNTDLVNGTILLSRETEHVQQTRETKTKLGFYRFADKDNLVRTRHENMTILFDEETMVVALDTWLFLSNAVGMHKYDMPTKQWTLCTPAVGSRYKLVLAEGKQLYGIEYSHYKCPVSKYIIEENKWQKLANMKFPLKGNDFVAIESRGILFVFGGNERHEGCIQAFDTQTNECYVLKITLPSLISSIQSKRYKNQLIILGKQNCFIYNINDLHLAFDYCKKFALRPKSLQTGANSEELESTPEHPDVGVLSKPGIGRSSYCAELIGNQLVVMGGLSDHPKFVKEMVATDVTDLLEEKKVMNWRTVGLLTNDNSRYNVSKYKSASVTFKQN